MDSEAAAHYNGLKGFVMGNAVQSATEICRKCQAVIPVTPGYPVWCDKCNWNIDPRILPPKRKALEKVIDIIARGASRSLFERLKKSALKKPGLTPAKVLLYLVALVIHLSNLLLMAACISISAYIFIGYSSFGFTTYFFCLLMLLLAFLLRPRLPKMKYECVSRKEYPGLYAAADKVSAFLGARSVALTITSDYNAFYAKIGIKKAVVGIGVPLFAALDTQEKLAILGHEIAHGVNGDAARSVIVYSAMLVLQKYYEFFQVGRFADGMRVAGPFAFIWNIIRWVMSKFTLLMWFLIQLIAYRDQQRAEYYADFLGATVSGSGAAKRALKKLFLALDFDFVMHTTARGENVLDRFLYRAEQLPEREQERLRRLSDMQLFRINVTHPPTQYRIGFLETEPQMAGLSLNAKEIDMMNADIERLKPIIQKKLQAHLVE
jgi:Zn-dependent protease with chaperone function